MAGKFEGFDEDLWRKIEPYAPKIPYVFGRPSPNVRHLLNTIMYVLITGCRWCDVPVGSEWGKRSTAHRYLGKWNQDGTWNALKRKILDIADLAGVVDWNNGSVDGSFSPRKRGR